MKTLDRINYIKTWILDYCKSMQKEPDSLVVGISGGIDSSVTSTICALTKKKTIVLLMPIKQRKEQQNLRLVLFLKATVFSGGLMLKIILGQ